MVHNRLADPRWPATIMGLANPMQFLQMQMEVPDAVMDRIAEIEEKHEGIPTSPRWISLEMIASSQASLQTKSVTPTGFKRRIDSILD